tara:strand:- start:131 stop:493 length:363 start_codon:yes stop_codon:yes gene_type:complete
MLEKLGQPNALSSWTKREEPKALLQWLMKGFWGFFTSLRGPIWFFRRLNLPSLASSLEVTCPSANFGTIADQWVQITDKGFENLKDLSFVRTLSIRNMSMRNSGALSLCKLNNLTSLNLS